MRPARFALAAVVALGALAGCGSPEPAPAPAPAPVTAAPPTAAPGGDEAFCTAQGETTETVRNLVVPAIESGPILPRAAAFLLLNSRNRATMTVVQSPELVVAQTELVAAIDDIDAQGRAGLPPGGNPGATPVQLDATRLAAAVAAVEVVCAG